MSLRFRLNLVIILAMAVIVGLGTMFTIYNARKSVKAEVHSSMNLALRSVKAGLAGSARYGDTLSYWRTRLNPEEKWRHSRIRIIPPSGKILELTGAKEQRAVRAAPAWFALWIRPESRSETHLIDTLEGSLRIVIEDDPDDEITEAWGEAKGLFGLILLQALLVGMLVQLTLGRALRPLPMILTGLESIQNGNFGKRLPEFPVPELDQISRAFNHAASAIEKAYRENRALTFRMLNVQEEERRSLARELHDELGQSLTGIKVSAGSIAAMHRGSPSAVESIIVICDHLFSVLRSMMRRLRPTVLDELGLGAALEDMISTWRERNPDIEVGLSFDRKLEFCDGNITIQLFRIVQESLNNVARHAHAKHIEISVQRVSTHGIDRNDASQAKPADLVRLTVCDDGRGFDPRVAHSGFGLLGMRERAESLGGRFTLQNRALQGVSILVEIPVAGLSQ
ncbi:MAG: histidine kinase [Methylococcaceae bacterium]|nr:histidine kinase [Methylococcaceae bacterium]